MDRRRFLMAGALGAAGSLVGGRADCAPATSGSSGSVGLASFDNYSAEDHRRRLQNIADCHRGIRASLRRHLIADYLPGQCCYNMCEYPRSKPWLPDERDEQELDRLGEHGIRLLQLHDEWMDSIRLYGGHRFAPPDPAAFRRFVDMVHRRKMKVIVYVSSGFFDRRDPDFRPEWARPQDLREMYWDAARCSPASPGWRAYLLPHLRKVLDEYEVDGFYNDLGYLRLADNPRPPTEDEVLAFDETKDSDGALADLLGLIYSEVHRRGGIVKVHCSNVRRPMTDMKVYDYLWVGETVRNGDALRDAVKSHPPYVVPCLDMSRAKIENENELYLQAVPYLQFPLLLAGRPFTGERAAIPGVKYWPEEKCFWIRHLRAIWKHYQEHPEGPHSYGWWDSVPGRPEARPTHARWLKQYIPMTEEGTWAWIELGDNDLVRRPAEKNVVVSAFANRHLYLALANYEGETLEVATAERYESLADPLAAAGTQWRLPGRSLHILRRSIA